MVNGNQLLLYQRTCPSMDGSNSEQKTVGSGQWTVDRGPLTVSSKQSAVESVRESNGH
jgi:hypothetical protein